MRQAHFLLIAGLLIIDQISKYWADHTLSFFKEWVIVPKILSLQLVHNSGAAFGIFQNQRLFLVSISLLVIIVALRWSSALVQRPIGYWGLAFLVGGSLGNLIDRLLHGHVIDMFNIHILPVFNIADISINIAVLCLIIDSIQSHRHA